MDQNKPTHRHHCDKCEYVLSTFRQTGGVIDWYVHPGEGIHGVVIGRISSEGGDYWSMPTVMIDDDRYLIAYKPDTGEYAASPMLVIARAVLRRYYEKKRKQREAVCPTVRLTATDVQIPRPDSKDHVELWGLAGMPGVLYPTKIAAEVAARERWPHEDPDKRYARVHFERFYPEIK